MISFFIVVDTALVTLNWQVPDELKQEADKRIRALTNGVVSTFNFLETLPHYRLHMWCTITCFLPNPCRPQALSIEGERTGVLMYICVHKSVCVDQYMYRRQRVDWMRPSHSAREWVRRNTMPKWGQPHSSPSPASWTRSPPMKTWPTERRNRN